MKLLAKLLTGVSALLLGMYVGWNVLPEYISAQKPLAMDSLTGLYDPDADTGVFNNTEVSSAYIPPLAYADVLGENTSNKRIEVDLTNQKLYAFEDNDKKYEFPISSGLWGRTPTGEFRIWIKLRYTKMEGGSKALNTYYYLPNVPYTMYFANDEIPSYRGFGIHGAYWHNNFGHPMSHGCINMRISDAEQIFYWAEPDLRGKASIRATSDNPGTRVIIYGTAPPS